MRLIDADALLKDIEEYHLSDGKFQQWVQIQPTIEAEPVIRCWECRWFTDCTKAVSTTPEGVDIEWCECCIHDDIMPENGYCSKAERKNE